ncbi:GNAT family N-acetyltransferase [Chitinophaga sp. Cy-1792]|uniref:GNAT family N-acetyltransferase n=1 Tax=Chitinophaga sp. Cy-1792 TaxID=2608339 RepID=UPI00142238CF|nr:GNAT family N-acetyltransferase [Chitinophaga sp. Cy-1792]NIG53222.1 GNAT family N-acetyltransferase [Chitinophaga sp. Cy-1792]
MTFLHDFHDLRLESTEKITDTFNLAFSDYLVPLHLTPSMLEEKMAAENLQRNFSIGAFNGSELCGFILHGTDSLENPLILYNGGTGVIPAYRGQRLVQQMYESFIPIYQQEGILQIILEVISTNQKAINAYKGSGFTQTRLLHSYKGDVQITRSLPEIEIVHNPSPDWLMLAGFMDMEPAWSNRPQCIKREASVITWEARKDGKVVGYLAINKNSRRIRNISVAPDYRRQGIGSALLKHATEALSSTAITALNVDDDFPEISLFFENAGMVNWLSQYEMVADI